MFERTEYQQTLFLEAQQFALNNLAFADGENDVFERDRGSVFSREIWATCAGAGVLGLFVDESLGGRNLTLTDSIAYLEGLGFGCTDNGLTYGLSSQLWAVVDLLHRFGDEDQKLHWLAPTVRGERIGCFAMTEPESGSDCFALQANAEKTATGYRINGVKQLITFAPVADYAIVFALTDASAGRWGISAFIIDANTPGFERSPMQAKMGLRTTPIGQITLTNCDVPSSALLSNEGAGASIFSTAQEIERGFVLATQLGAMQRQLDACVKQVRDRVQFGQHIGKFQSVSNRIVDMRLRVDTGRLMLYKTAALKDAGEPAMLEAAMTNLLIAEAGLASSIDAVRIHGGRGYLSEFEIERDMRDAMGAPLYGGTSDIQRDIIARLMGI